jgi:hypothetical protein
MAPFIYYRRDGVVLVKDSFYDQTTPSAPLRNGNIFLMAQPPLLG